MTLTLAAEFAKRGHRAAIVSLLRGISELPEAGVALGNIAFIALEASHTRAAFGRLQRFFRDWQPDIVVSSQPHVSLLTIFVRMLSRWRFALVIIEHAPIQRLIGISKAGNTEC